MISALLGSLHAPSIEDSWQVAGLYSRAINLAGESGNLLTLHRAGNGLSPMGWVLKSDDFDALRASLNADSPVIAHTGGIQLGAARIRQPERRCLLRQMAACNVRLADAHYLARGESTGLYGPLATAIARPINGELNRLKQLFRQAIKGKEVNWCPHLGKGPGLTPTHDDMLVGMLLAASVAGALPDLPFFAASNCLRAATTQVSVAYLQHAAQGVFASPLLYFASALAEPRRLPFAIEQLLALGHTSGADTLLGFWLGQQALGAL